MSPPPPLLDFSEPVERAELEARLSAVVQDPEDVFGWCARPQLYPLVRVGGSPLPTFDGIIDWRTKLQRDSATIVRSGALVAIADTANQRRVVDPVALAHAELTGAAPVDARPCPEPARIRKLLGSATEWTSSTLAGVGSVDLELEPAELHHLALVVARTVARALSVLAPGDVLLLANLHVPTHRAWLWVARERDIPCVYVPHAPAARNRSYADLPVTIAALRGPAEIDAYAAAGADARGLVAAGNPGFASLDRLAPAVPTAPLVVAPPQDLEEATALVEIVAAVDPPSVVVAPHPAADRRALDAVMPDSWPINPPRVPTSDLIRKGAKAVLQSSSGLGWEALHLGVPVVDCALDDRLPRYLYLDEVPAARTADGLRDALAVRWPARACRELADRWCPTVGVEAATVIAELIGDAARSASDGMILDGWFGGPAGGGRR